MCRFLTLINLSFTKVILIIGLQMRRHVKVTVMEPLIVANNKVSQGVGCVYKNKRSGRYCSRITKPTS